MRLFLPGLAATWVQTFSGRQRNPRDFTAENAEHAERKTEKKSAMHILLRNRANGPSLGVEPLGHEFWMRGSIRNGCRPVGVQAREWRRPSVPGMRKKHGRAIFVGPANLRRLMPTIRAGGVPIGGTGSPEMARARTPLPMPSMPSMKGIGNDYRRIGRDVGPVRGVAVHSGKRKAESSRQTGRGGDRGEELKHQTKETDT